MLYIYIFNALYFDVFTLRSGVELDGPPKKKKILKFIYTNEYVDIFTMLIVQYRKITSHFPLRVKSLYKYNTLKWVKKIDKILSKYQSLLLTSFLRFYRLKKSYSH